MKIDKDHLDKIKENFQNGNGTTKPDDARVVIAEMQYNQLKELSNDQNQIFSELSTMEVFDVSRAYVFAENALPSISERLKARGIKNKDGSDIIFKLPVLTHFLDENLKHRHKIGRKRVDEYIKALKAIAVKQLMTEHEEPRKPGLLGRLV